MPRKRQKLCFVLMPFKDEHREVYDKAIKPACVLTGFKSLRVDEVPGVYNINRKIIEYIFNSDAIIADLSDWNPNVFYEMGAAHAIDNKTIMIIDKKDKVPFDVSAYSCILYHKTDTGLNNLKERIAETLEQIEEWRKHPTNPVQDFKPHDAFILKSDFEQLQKELKQKDAHLKKAVSKAALTALRRELREKEKLLSNSPAGPSRSMTTKPSLRSEPLDALAVDDVKKMLKEKALFDSRYHKKGKGSKHKYQFLEQEGAKLVKDENTGLTWQQSGSGNQMNFENADNYIEKLNDSKYAGLTDWRLPTLEEAMSLMEPEKKEGGLFLDSVFDQTERWIWTADKESASLIWSVNFFSGYCGSLMVGLNFFVRAVRE